MSAPGTKVRPTGAPGKNGSEPGAGAVRPAPSSRQVRRRRNLPGSRAVAGGLLVAAAAVGLFAAYQGMHGGPSHSYVVAARPVAAGAKVEASDLAMEAIDLPPRVQARAFNDLAALVGATAVTKLEPGELVQPSAVVAKAGDQPGREVSFPVERGHLSATLEEGERVDLLATFGGGNDAYTTVVLQNAQVVSIERAKVGLGDTGAAVLAVSIDDDGDEVAVGHAIQEGKLTVVRATGAPPPPGPGSPSAYRPEQPPTAAFPDGRTKGTSP